MDKFAADKYVASALNFHLAKRAQPTFVRRLGMNKESRHFCSRQQHLILVARCSLVVPDIFTSAELGVGWDYEMRLCTPRPCFVRLN